jgi:GT2 family glycosyltransferase
VADHAVIGYLRREDVKGKFSESLLAIAMEGPSPLEAVLALEWGPNLSTGRNKLADDFLRRYSAPWLLMVDTDMVLPVDVLPRLIAAADPVERPVVGGLCYSLEAGEAKPTMYELVQAPDGELGFRRWRDVPEDQCVRVSATGAACLLIHRDALLAVEKHANDPAAPWFRETAIGAPMSLMGEDLTFCLRCAAAGIPVHVHTGVHVGHMKTTMLI